MSIFPYFYILLTGRYHVDVPTFYILLTGRFYVDVPTFDILLTGRFHVDVPTFLYTTHMEISCRCSHIFIYYLQGDFMSMFPHFYILLTWRFHVDVPTFYILLTWRFHVDVPTLYILLTGRFHVDVPTFLYTTYREISCRCSHIFIYYSHGDFMSMFPHFYILLTGRFHVDVPTFYILLTWRFHVDVPTLYILLTGRFHIDVLTFEHTILSTNTQYLKFHMIHVYRRSYTHFHILTAFFAYPHFYVQDNPIHLQIFSFTTHKANQFLCFNHSFSYSITNSFPDPSIKQYTCK